MNLPLRLAAVLVPAALAACADTYCQSGPQYGTSCYSGATVAPHDPLAPVAPLPPPGHGRLFASPPAADAAPPQMIGQPRDAGSPPEG